MKDINSKFFYDENKDRVTIAKTQDISDIVKANKAQYNEGTKVGAEFRKIASIPLVVMEELIKQQIFDTQFQLIDPKAFNRWLQDSDNQVFRTSPERL